MSSDSIIKFREVTVPDIGDFRNVPVIEVLVREGDEIAEETPLVTLESDKATMDVPSPFAGRVVELIVAVGSKVSEGSPLLLLETRVKRAPVQADLLANEVAEVAAVLDGETQTQGKPEPQPATAPAAKASTSAQEPAPPISDTAGDSPAGGSSVITVPDIGDFSDVEVIDVLVSPGNVINAEDPLVTLESDKATMDVPASSGGRIVEVLVKKGDRVSEGTPIARIEASGKPEPAQTSPPPETRKEPQVSPPSVAAPAPVTPAATPGPRQPPVNLPPPAEKSGVATPHASPSIRRFARELGVDLVRVRGTGPKGRILHEDVQSFVKQQMSQPAAATGSVLPEMPDIDFTKFGEVDVQPLNRIKLLTAANLHRAWLHVPHVTHHDEADITELEEFRGAMKDEAKAQGVRLTPLAFIMKACVATLKKYPTFNASLEKSGKNLVIKRYYHIGVAVDTPDGLVVPVVRDADRKGVMTIARELGELSERARNKKLSPTDLQGASFTISSLGGIGGTGFTPIVNAPEVAILGVTRSQMKPVYQDGEFVPRLMLPLSLSYDHRVIDGAEAARFTAFLAQMLADLRRLAL